MSKIISLSALLALSLAGPVAAAPEKNPSVATSGEYSVDKRHASLLASVGHQGGVSKSVFRFNNVDGALRWNGAEPAASSLSITIDPRSITSPVEGFSEELAGDKFLKAGLFPTIRFESTAVRITGANHGQVVGDLTFLGVRKPVTLDVSFGGVARPRRVQSWVLPQRQSSTDGISVWCRRPEPSAMRSKY